MDYDQMMVDKDAVREKLAETCKRMNIGLRELGKGHFRLTGGKLTVDFWPWSVNKTVWFKKRPTDKKGVTLHGKDIDTACLLAGRRTELAVDIEAAFGGIAMKVISVDESSEITSESAAPWAVQKVGRAIKPVAQPDIPWAEGVKQENNDDRTLLLIKLENAERNRDEFKEQMREFAAKLDNATAEIEELKAANAKLTEQVIAQQFDAHQARQTLKSANREIAKANTFIAEISDAFRKAKAKAMAD